LESLAWHLGFFDDMKLFIASHFVILNQTAQNATRLRPSGNGFAHLHLVGDDVRSLQLFSILSLATSTPTTRDLSANHPAVSAARASSTLPVFSRKYS